MGNLAVSDRAGYVELLVPQVDGREQHELASIAQVFETEGRRHRVKAVTLDSEGLSDIGLLKIDVEQHERAVLMGGMVTSSTSRPVIMIDVSPLLYPDRLDVVFSFLTDAGYRGCFRFDSALLPLSQYEPDVHARASNWGGKGEFMGGNMFVFPCESGLAKHGP